MKVRIRSWYRLAFSMIILPVVSVLIIPFGNCFRLLFIGNIADYLWYGYNGCLSGIFGYIVYGMIPAVLTTALFAMPLILIALKIGATRAWQFIFVGAVSGAVVSIILWLLFEGSSLFGILMMVTSLSAGSAFVLWLVGIYKNFHL